MDNSTNTDILTLDDIYVSPFTSVREYDREGNISYIPIVPSRKTTGVGNIDKLTAAIAAGHNRKHITSTFGLDYRELNGIVRLLTGMEYGELALKLALRAADELLRYTDLPIAEVAARSHIGSEANMRRIFASIYHCSPSERRRDIRQPRDVGKYR